jgi:hypothetical protein
MHNVEPWKNRNQNREVYIIRCMPIYDTRIKLKSKLHGKIFNNFLIDLESGSVIKHDREIDLSKIPEIHKLPLTVKSQF